MDKYNSQKLYFDIKKKSFLVAYILLFLLFCVGAHRFYTKNNFSAIIILISTIFTILLVIVSSIFPPLSLLAVLLFIYLTIWFIIDIFLTQKNVSMYNLKLAGNYGLLEKRDI